jgi:MFS transporter, ACS family, tartrate transporter
VGFAALIMNKDLGLDAATFGFAAGVFFWGYFLFEVPSNLLLEKLGARVWIARKYRATDVAAANIAD